MSPKSKSGSKKSSVKEEKKKKEGNPFKDETKTSTKDRKNKHRHSERSSNSKSAKTAKKNLSVLSEECTCKKMCKCAYEGKKSSRKDPSTSSERSASNDASRRSSASRQSSTPSSMRQSLSAGSPSIRSPSRASSSAGAPSRHSSQTRDYFVLTSIQEETEKTSLKSGSIAVKSEELSLEGFSSGSSSGESVRTIRSSFFESKFNMFHDIEKMKTFLKSGAGVTLYDHLSDIVHKVIGNRLIDSANYVESLSKDVKEERFLYQGDTLRDKYKKPKNICEVRKLNSLYKAIHSTDGDVKYEGLRSSVELDEANIPEMSGMLSEDMKEPDQLRVPNFIESNHYFKQAGFGLPDWEVFDLTVSVAKLVKKMENVFSKIRFFGKIFGHHKYYYVLETEFTLEEIERCKQIQLQLQYEREQALLEKEKVVEEDVEEEVAGEEQGEGIDEGDQEVTTLDDDESVRRVTTEIEVATEEDIMREMTHDELIKYLTEKCEKMMKEVEEKKSKSISSSKDTRRSSARTGSMSTRSSKKDSMSGRSSSGASKKTRSTSLSDSYNRKSASSGVSKKRRSTFSGSSRVTQESGSDFMLADESKATTVISYTSEDIRRGNEEMVNEILTDLIMQIMECIAVDFLMDIQNNMPCLPPEPGNKWLPPKDVPLEDIGEGLNKSVFWVCNSLDEDWICLPDVSPKNIEIARKIHLGFTGNLETEIISYPPFNGKEKDYLRAQLARINAATSISPMGYYVRTVNGEDFEDVPGMHDEGEYDEENFDYDDRIDIKKNPQYKNRGVAQLANESLSLWVHHRKEIKKDGRITWWEEDDEQTDDYDEDDGTETEQTFATRSLSNRMPRPLFKPLSREADWMDTANVAWTVKRHSSYLGGPSIVALKSLRWPGAVAYATFDGKSDYMYIGWGLKSISGGYRPLELPPFYQEYPTGDDIMETLDPSVTDEEDQLEEDEPRLRPRKSAKSSTSKESGDSRENSEMLEEEEELESNSEQSSDSE